MDEEIPEVKFDFWDYIISGIGVHALRIFKYYYSVIFLLSGFIAFLFLCLIGRRGRTTGGKSRPIIKPGIKDMLIVGTIAGVLYCIDFAIEGSIYTNPEFAIFTGLYLPQVVYIFGIIIAFLVPFIGSLLSFLIARYLFRVC